MDATYAHIATTALCTLKASAATLAIIALCVWEGFRIARIGQF